jgi:Flp pilus assembly protein protease CpaA
MSIFGLFIVYAVVLVMQQDISTLYGHLIAGSVMFVVTFIFFALNMFGAGDSKLATSIAFWVGLVLNNAV